MTSLLLRAIVLFLSVVVFTVACGGGETQPGKTPTGARASCSADADCVVTNEGGGACCAVCPDAPRAIPQLAFEQHKNKCAAASCKPASDTERVECPKVEAVVQFVAKCKDGTCAAVKH